MDEAESAAEQVTEAGPVPLDRLRAAELGDVIYVVRLEPELEVAYISANVERSLGYSPAEYYEDPSLIERSVDPRDREILRAALVAPVGEDLDLSVRWITRDDRILWTHHRAGKRTDEQGRVVLYGAVHDVTALTEAIDRSAAAEERLRLVTNFAEDVLLSYRPDGVLQWASPSLQRVFAWDPEKVIGSRFRLAIPGDRPANDEHLARAIAAHEEALVRRTRVGTADGVVRWADTVTRLAWNDNGELDFLVVTARDVTAQVDAEVARHASEERLAESEEHFRLLAENASDVVVRVGEDGAVQWVSQSLTRVTGWAPEQIIGTRLIELVHPDDAAAAHAIQQQTQDREVQRYETRIRTADGTYRWFSINVRPVSDASGQSVTRIGGWRDIDDEVHARQLAAQREAQFQMVAENSADVVLRVDAEWRIKWVSPSADTMLGWDPEDVIDRRLEDYVHPDDVTRYRDEIAVLESADRGSFDVRFQLADGTFLWFSDITTQIRDSQGRVITRVVGLRNVDAEVRANQALALSEQRFRLAMDSAPIGMALVDLDRKFVEVNQALVTMIDRDAQWLVAHRVPDILPPDDQAVDLKMRALVLSGRVASASQEHRVLRADGNLVWVQHSLGLLRDEEGTPLSYVSQFLDVTEAREARRDLEFLASHDALTRLANRRALVDHMQRILAHRPRSGSRLGVLFLDLDGLKPINDRFGHAVGDQVIVEIAQLIREQVRGDDLVARFGGDEFVVLLPDVAGLNDVSSVGDKVRRIVAESKPVAHLGFPVTVSVGAAVADPGDTPDQVLRKADSAVYRAKGAGGNRTEFYDVALDGA